ncbi:MAG TPA: RNA polymerase sigma factor [Cytophagaceae bacterium]|jgi:RNA polymerase sigma-70 factor (ECF subfamily)
MVDKKVIQKCIDGDRNAEEYLYRYYAPKMKSLCIRYARSGFEAEDIFQEAFIKVFRNLKHFSFQGSFDGWIRRIVVNTAIDHYNKNLDFNSHANFETVHESSIDFVEIADQLGVDELKEVINKLPDGYKLIFNLYAVDGYAHKEIADMLKISEGTSKSQLAKARKYIKNILVKYNTILR